LALAGQRIVVEAVLGNDVVDDVDLAANEAFLGEPAHGCDVLIGHLGPPCSVLRGPSRCTASRRIGRTLHLDARPVW
jgi:hypothetical protein